MCSYICAHAYICVIWQRMVQRNKSLLFQMSLASVLLLHASSVCVSERERDGDKRAGLYLNGTYIHFYLNNRLMVCTVCLYFYTLNVWQTFHHCWNVMMCFHCSSNNSLLTTVSVFVFLYWQQGRRIKMLFNIQKKSKGGGGPYIFRDKCYPFRLDWNPARSPSAVLSSSQHTLCLYKVQENRLLPHHNQDKNAVAKKVYTL